MSRESISLEQQNHLTRYIVEAFLHVREEKYNQEAMIHRQLEDGWESSIRISVSCFIYDDLCHLGASVSLSFLRGDMMHLD